MPRDIPSSRNPVYGSPPWFPAPEWLLQRRDLSLVELRIVLAVLAAMNHMGGDGRARITMSQFIAAAGHGSDRHVRVAVNRLIEKKILTRDRDDRGWPSYVVNPTPAEYAGVPNTRGAESGGETPAESAGVPPAYSAGTLLREHIKDIDTECSEPAAGDSLDSFPSFACKRGKKSKAQHWQLPDSLATALAAAFPGVDVPAECRNAHSWIQHNPTKRKTGRGMPEFLRRWMQRAQSSSGNGSSHRPGRANGQSRTITARQERIARIARTVGTEESNHAE